MILAHKSCKPSGSQKIAVDIQTCSDVVRREKEKKKRELRGEKKKEKKRGPYVHTFGWFQNTKRDQ